MGDAQVQPSKQRHGAFEGRKSPQAQAQQDPQFEVQGVTPVAQPQVNALQRMKDDKKRQKKQYQDLRRQQIEDLQLKRAEIMKNNVDKQRQEESRLKEKKRKMQEEKERQKAQNQ